MFYIRYKICQLIKINLKIQMQYNSIFPNHPSKHEYNAMASFQRTANIRKTRDKYCLLSFMHRNEIGLLIKLIYVWILIRCEGVGKNLKFNKRLPSCIKHPRSCKVSNHRKRSFLCRKYLIYDGYFHSWNYLTCSLFS